jgi:hypothetical protein
MKLLAQVDFTNLSGLRGPNNSYVTYPLVKLAAIVESAVPFIFTFAAMLLLVYLIFGGLQLMLSRGDPKATQGAKSHISNALIGFVIVFISYWVVQLFGLILGLNGIATIFK